MKKRVLAAMLTAMTALSVCGMSALADDNELVLFTWENMFPQEVLDGFEEETGVKVVYSNFDTDETMLEKLSQAKGGDYDVVVADDYIIEQAVNEGLVSELDKDAITNFGNINPLYQGQFYDPDDKYTVPYGAGIPLIVYDPSVVGIEIKGFGDLWDASLTDSLGLIDDARVTIGMVLLSMGQSMNTTDDAILAEAAEKLDALKSNIHVLEYENLHNYLVSGDVAVAYTFTPFVALALNANPDLKVVWPEEGLGFGIDGCFIPSAAPHAKNANLFLEFLLRPEIAAICAEWQYYCSPNAAAQDCLEDWYKENPVFNGIYDRIGDAEYVMNLSTEDEQKFQDIWTKFKLSL